MICAKIKIILACIVDFLDAFFKGLLAKNHYEVLTNILHPRSECIQLVSIACS